LRFPDPGVAHELKVLCLFPQRNPHHFVGFRGLEADAITLLYLVKLLRREHEWAAKNAPVLHLPEPLDVFWDGKPEHRQQADTTFDKADSEDGEQPLAVEDCVA
jgi:hypothetical protein